MPTFNLHTVLFSGHPLPWHDGPFKRLAGANAGLLALSIGMSLLFQLVTDGICHSKALFMLLASGLFWGPAGYGLYRKAGALSWGWAIALGLATVAANQVFVRYAVEWSMQVCFSCAHFEASWVPYFLSNNLLVNWLCYAGFVAFARRDTRPDVPAPLTPAPPAPSPTFADLLPIKDGPRQYQLPAASIRWVEVEHNCITIVATDTRIVLYQSLQTFAALLDPRKFKRIHRARLVNVAQVVRVTNLPSGDGWVEMRCGAKLKVSRVYKKDLLADWEP
jgi:hypothetical protein